MVGSFAVNLPQPLWKVLTLTYKPCLKPCVQHKHQSMNTLIYYLIGCYSQNSHHVWCITFPLLLPSSLCTPLFHIPTYLKIFLPISLPLFLNLFSLCLCLFLKCDLFCLHKQTNRPLAEQEILHTICCISGSLFFLSHLFLIILSTLAFCPPLYCMSKITSLSHLFLEFFPYSQLQ